MGTCLIRTEEKSQTGKDVNAGARNAPTHRTHRRTEFQMESNVAVPIGDEGSMRAIAVLPIDGFQGVTGRGVFFYILKHDPLI